MVDTTNLTEKLSTLSGLDFEQAEKLERAAGNTFPELTFSKSFQARLAAMALNVTIHEIKSLPLKQYAQICAEVFNFLFGTSENATPLPPSEV